MHASENWTTVPQLLATRHNLWMHWSCDGSVYSDTVYPHRTYSGRVESLRRDNSNHTTPDQFGWREPTAYYFNASTASASASSDSLYARNCSTVFTPINYYPDSYWEWDPGLNPDCPPGSLELLNARNWIRTKAAGDLNRSECNLAQTFAERKKTYQMVLGAIKDVAQLIHDARKGRLGKVVQRLADKDLASMWLATRYGWMPTLMDVHGALDLLQKHENGFYDHLRVYVKKREVLPWESHHSKLTDGGKLSFVSSTYGAWKIKCRYDYKVNTSDYRTLASSGVLDPIGLAWELVPYSFVVDWFLNVGDFLEAFAYQGDFTFLGGSQTLFSECEEIGRFEVTPSGYDCYCPALDHRMVRFERWVEGKPVPRFALNPDLFVKQAFGPVRIVDAVSLIVNAFGKSGGGRRYR